MWMKMFALQISVGGGAQRWPSRVRALATGASSGGYDFLPNSWDSPSSWSPCDCESPHLVLLPFHGMGTEDLMCPTQPLPAPFAVYSLAPPSSRQRQGYEPAPSSRQSDVLIRQALETRVSFSSLLPQLHLCSSGGHGGGVVTAASVCRACDWPGSESYESRETSVSELSKSASSSQKWENWDSEWLTQKMPGK